MKVYVVVGYNRTLNNASARVAFSKREDAQRWMDHTVSNWFDDKSKIIELELDAAVPKEVKNVTG